MKQFAEAIAKEAQGKSKADITKLMKEAVAILAEHGEIGRWRELEAAINKAWSTVYGASTITVISAHPLSEAAKAELEKRGAGADLVEVVDDRLIGGAIVRVDNTRIDGSITGMLMRLKQAMYSEV